MELKEFISQTLVQIAEGISEANEQLSASDAVVNPPNVSVSNSSSNPLYGTIKKDFESTFTPVQKIDFDISVTATKGSGTNGGIKIGIGTISLGSEGRSENENQANNRIKFSVPMVMPYGATKI
jgi:hypothetical protein